MRLGIEVRSGYLILSNIPWSQPVAIPAVEARALNGAELAVAPGAVRLGLPGLFATQSEQSQRAALAGMAALYPLLLTVGATPEAAAARHAALFGWKPVHPGPGQWVVDGRADREQRLRHADALEGAGVPAGGGRLRALRGHRAILGEHAARGGRPAGGHPLAVEGKIARQRVQARAAARRPSGASSTSAPTPVSTAVAA